MLFTWDENKSHSNLIKHGIDFFDAKEIFLHPVIVKIDERFDYGEKRWIALGKLADVIIVVTFTMRNGKIRIISARKANRKERKYYYERNE
jgi:uncharacterized protein